MKFPEVDTAHFPQPDASKEGQCEGAPNPLQAENDELRGRLDALQHAMVDRQERHALDLADRDRRIQDLEEEVASKERAIQSWEAKAKEYAERLGDSDPSRG